MRKRFHFIGVITLAVLTLFTLSACPDPDPEVIQDVTISVDTIIINNNVGSGTLRVVNKATNDTLLCSGGLSGVDPNYRISVSNGDVVKMEYVADEAYKDFLFTAKYILWDTSTITLTVNTVYEYEVSGLSSGSYKIKWEAISGQSEEGTTSTIYGSGNFSIIVRE